MNTQELSEKLAGEALGSLSVFSAPAARREDVAAIVERCCLNELFDIVESAERIELHNYCDGMLMPRIRTLKAKLKERGIEL